MCTLKVIFGKQILFFMGMDPVQIIETINIAVAILMCWQLIQTPDISGRNVPEHILGKLSIDPFFIEKLWLIYKKEYCPTLMLPSHSNTCHVVCHKQTQGFHEIWKLCHDVIVILKKEQRKRTDITELLLFATPFTAIYCQHNPMRQVLFFHPFYAWSN